MNLNPLCDRDDCKFSQSSVCSYSDEKSKQVNCNECDYISLVNCVTCSKSWTVITSCGKTVYSETK